MKQKTFILLLALILVVLGLYLFKDQIFKVEKTTELTNSETEKLNQESAEIVKNKKNDEFLFKVASVAEEYPKFISGKLDPENVLPGMTQKMEIKLKDPDGVQSVKAKIEHDEGFDEVELKLTEGTEFEGTWTGEWSVHSTHDKFYKTIFTATNKKDQSDVLTLAWKDSCPMGKGSFNGQAGQNPVYPSCTITDGAVGTMDGEIVIGANNTVVLGEKIPEKGGPTLNGYLVFGSRVTFQAGGKFVLAGGTLIKNGNPAHSGHMANQKAAICLPDRDNDGYWDKNVLSGIFIPEDKASCTEIEPENSYKPITAFNFNLLGGVGNDCCDIEPLANPSAGLRYNQLPSACGGGWDWNCNGIVEKECEAFHNTGYCLCSYSSKGGAVTVKCEGSGHINGWVNTIPDCGQSGTYRKSNCLAVSNQDQCCQPAGGGEARINNFYYFVKKIELKICSLFSSFRVNIPFCLAGTPDCGAIRTSTNTGSCPANTLPQCSLIACCDVSIIDSTETQGCR